MLIWIDLNLDFREALTSNFTRFYYFALFHCTILFAVFVLPPLEGNNKGRKTNTHSFRGLFRQDKFLSFT